MTSVFLVYNPATGIASEDKNNFAYVASSVPPGSQQNSQQHL